MAWSGSFRFLESSGADSLLHDSTDLMKLQTQEELDLPDEDNLGWVFTGIGRFYQGQGLYAEAEPWFENCLTVVRSLLGEQHLDVASSLNHLAVL